MKRPLLCFATWPCEILVLSVSCRLLNSNSLTTIRDDAFSGLPHLEYLWVFVTFRVMIPPSDRAVCMDFKEWWSCNYLVVKETMSIIISDVCVCCISYLASQRTTSVILNMTPLYLTDSLRATNWRRHQNIHSGDSGTWLTCKLFY